MPHSFRLPSGIAAGLAHGPHRSDDGSLDVGANVTSLRVEGIETLAAYVRISNYLATLTSVSDVQVSEVTPTAVSYSLQLNGSQDSLMRTIAIGSVLEPVPGGMSGNYRLRQ